MWQSWSKLFGLSSLSSFTMLCLAHYNPGQHMSPLKIRYALAKKSRCKAYRWCAGVAGAGGVDGNPPGGAGVLALESSFFSFSLSFSVLSPPPLNSPKNDPDSGVGLSPSFSFPSFCCLRFCFSSYSAFTLAISSALTAPFEALGVL